MTLDPNNARAGVATHLLLPLKTLYWLGYMELFDGGVFEHPWNRLQATPLENPGPVQGATPSIGGHGVTQRTKAAAQLDD